MNRSIAIAPAILMVGLAVKTRTFNDSFEFVSPTQQQNSQILAYRGIVQESEKVNRDPYAHGSLQKFRAIGWAWVRGAANGTFVPLRPISYDDSPKDGIKGEILQQNQSVAVALLSYTEQEVRRGDYVDALSDAILGIRVANVLEYSDLQTTMQTSLISRRGFKQILEILPHVSASQRKSAYALLPSIRPRADKLSSLVALKKSLYLQYIERMQIEPTPIEKPEAALSGRPLYVHGQLPQNLLASARYDPQPRRDQMERLANEGIQEASKLFDEISSDLSPNTR